MDTKVIIPLFLSSGVREKNAMDHYDYALTIGH